MELTRYFVELSYDGTSYHGWQIQPNAITIQEVLQNAFSVILKTKVTLTGAGRTDTGVHASYFVAHFDFPSENLEDNDKLVSMLNGYLPDDIAIHSIFAVDHEMHARFSAKYREYLYVIRSSKPVFERPYSYYFYGNLDLHMMNDACKILFEYKNFTSFSKLHTDVKTNDCKILEALWIANEEGYEFRIKADRFLRNMVRSIVGTMLEIGTGKMDLSKFRKVIESKDRSMAGTSVPARGLFLVDIGY